MLNTINGFDLLLIITIVILAFKVHNLNKECNSYVHELVDTCRELNQLHLSISTPKPDPYDKLCNYCTEVDPWLSKCECDDF
jgi:hypothetical protein